MTDELERQLQHARIIKQFRQLGSTTAEVELGAIALARAMLKVAERRGRTFVIQELP